MTGVLRRKFVHRNAQTEDDMKIKREDDYLQAKERGLEEIPPSQPRKEPTLLILCAQTSNLRNHEKINICG